MQDREADPEDQCYACAMVRIKELEEAPLNLPGAVEAKNAVERVRVLELHNRALREALNVSLLAHETSGCKETCWFPRDLCQAALESGKKEKL